MTSAPAPARTRRRLGACAVALALPFGIAGCQLTSPMQTTNAYSPADGVHLEAGSLEIVDLLVVSTGLGEPGVVSGYAVNESDEPVTIDMALETEDGERIELSPSVEVPAGTALRIDGYDVTTGEFTDPVLVPEVPVRAGQLITVRITSGSDVVSERVPILLPDYPYGAYTEILASDS